MILEETIAAISTAPGTGAIAIVRMTGPNAWTIAGLLFSSKDTKQNGHIDQWKSHVALHGFLRHPGTNQLVDEVVVIPFKGPHSTRARTLLKLIVTAVKLSRVKSFPLFGKWRAYSPAGRIYTTSIYEWAWISPKLKPCWMSFRQKLVCRAELRFRH